MREILFKAKRKDNNEWIKGSLIYDVNEKWYIHKNNCALVIGTYEVIPETISQYTGLKDKNDVKIFENDKVKAKFYGKDVEGQIGFSNGCFLLWNSCVSDNQLFIFTDIEVIGNI